MQHLNQESLLNRSEPLVVLGEPGMGKTVLLSWLGRQPNMVVKTARAFLRENNPAALVSADQTLVIDGLDEVAAVQEGDPVHNVLKHLTLAGRPQFILSCRVADWRGAVARQDIEDDYSAKPLELTLEPFSGNEASAFLVDRFGQTRAEEIIEHFEGKGLNDFFGNPQTLILIADAAGPSGPLPDTRAGLFAQACGVMRAEHNDSHDKTALAQLTADAALDAAGAACAVLLLTAKDAISLRPAANTLPEDVQVAELGALPNGEAIEAVLRSRLFRKAENGDRRFTYVHRTIAEYLGAQWLAKNMTSPRVTARMLDRLMLEGRVPASVRGLHAWLAHFSVELAPEVINVDPYGVLRYGDADGLSVAQGAMLLDALKRLEDENPYFRAEDWNQHSARGLVNAGMLVPVRTAMLDPATGFHLRTLLLEAIKGSSLAPLLANDLLGLLLDQSYVFRERSDAGEALAALGQVAVNWPETVAKLNDQGGDDSTRLAVELLSEVGVEQFSDKLIANSILSHCGLIGSSANKERNRTIGMFHALEHNIPSDRAAGILDALAEVILPFRAKQTPASENWEGQEQLASLAAKLIVARLESGESDSRRIWGWLRAIDIDHGIHREERKRVTEWLSNNASVRQSIQRLVFFGDSEPIDLGKAYSRLIRASYGLLLQEGDVLHFLGELSERSTCDADARERWKFLIRYVRNRDGVTGEARPIAAAFAGDDVELLSFLGPPPPSEIDDWERKDRARNKRDERTKAKRWEKHRVGFLKDIDRVRAGEAGAIIAPAQSYLGMFRDGDRDLLPHERVGEWLGPEIQTAALEGFEAVLHRDDNPTAQKMAEGYANSKHWKIVYALIAGLSERMRTGKGLDDLSAETLIAGRVAFHGELMGQRDGQKELDAALERQLRREPTLYETYVRLLIEPYFNVKRTHVPGLYSFVRGDVDRDLAVRLSGEWLERYTDLPPSDELELMDRLAFSGELELLRKIGQEREKAGYKDDDHRRNWEAIEFLTDFDGVVAKGEPPSEFLWSLRHRLGYERREDRGEQLANVTQLAWVVRNFRGLWPNQERPSGTSSGDTNVWDASEFLRGIITRISGDTSDEAIQLLADLRDAPTDSYTDLLRFAAANQRNARCEARFAPFALGEIKAALEDGPPQSIADLLVIVVDELKALQARLSGANTNPVDLFFDGGKPKGENACRDTMLNLLRPNLSHGITFGPEVAMPGRDRADVAFQLGLLRLPLEAKGQWHRELWTAAQTQLEARYTKDWMAQGKGLYVIFWFGPNVPANKRLKSPPSNRGKALPQTPGELRGAFVASLPPGIHGEIEVFVLDVSR
jgi:hypothetical protein